MVASSVSPRSVRNHSGVAGRLGHRDRGKGLTQCANLIKFNENRIGDALVDTPLEYLSYWSRRGHHPPTESRTEFLGKDRPTRPIGFIETVLNGDNRMLIDQ